MSASIGHKLLVEDEPLKAAIHGLVLGVVLIPLFYNCTIRKWSNIAIYTTLVGIETYHILGHIMDGKEDVRIG